MTSRRRLPLSVVADGPTCAAPSVQVFLRPDGEVRACCRNDRPLGNAREATLTQIWDGARVAELRDALGEGRFDLGCEMCGGEAAVEGPAASYARIFDPWWTGTPARSPRRIEFNLSNACNLQCVQCDGDLSSSIRAHREHRPALTPAYDDAFFADLRSVVPHLEWASFAGGEPFLARENYVVWDMIAELHPGLAVTIVTNATQWSDRVESVWHRLRAAPTFSIDAVTPAAFEAIRVGADFVDVMANVDRYLAACSEPERAEVNFCLMAENVDELPGVLGFAERLGLGVNVSIVRSPAARSLTRLDPARLAEVLDRLLAHEPAALSERNRRVWTDTVDRIRSWVHADPSTLAATWGVGTHRVLMFPCEGAGPVDPDERAAAWAGWAAPPIRVDVDRHDRIVAVAGDADPLGLGDDLLGSGVDRFQTALASSRVVRTEPDEVDMEVELPGGAFRVLLVPERTEGGWAERAVMFFRAVGDHHPPSSPPPA